MNTMELWQHCQQQIFEYHIIHKQPPKKLPCTKELYEEIDQWYRNNLRLPLIDMETASDGYANIVFMGVTWYLDMEAVA